MDIINSILGKIESDSIETILCHEHICCFSEYLFEMGKEYLDKEELARKSIAELQKLKDAYGMNLFVDCTPPVNIGRDIELLKKVSKKSGVHIVCSAGFYYTDEPVLYNMSEEILAEYIVSDAKQINSGIIKAAVETEKFSPFNENLLKATALAHLKLGLPIVLHTNTHNKNGRVALEILLQNGMRSECITVGHLSDTEDVDYITEIAKRGCYIGLYRLYNDTNVDYINKKLKTILTLCEKGFENKILLSHDELFFNGFESKPKIKETKRFDYVFKNILPRLDASVSDTIIKKNPIRMLTLGGLK